MSDVHRKDVELYRGLEPVLGADVATMLLERLPPPQEELATKRDIRELDPILAGIDRRFEQIDRRFEQIDRRFEQIDQRFEQVDQRFEQVDQRFEQVDQRFEQLEEKLDLRFAAQAAELKGFVHEVVGTQIQAQTRTILFGMAGIMFGATTLAVALGRVV